MNTSTPSTPSTSRPVGRPPAPRGTWVAPAAALTWLAAAGAALAVTLTGRALPVGDAGDNWNGVWSHLPAAALTPWVAVLVLAGAALSVWTWRGGRAAPVPRAARVTTAVGAIILLTGAVTLVDASILAQLGYLPITLIVAPFDADLRQAFLDSITLSGGLQIAVLTLAALLAAATVRFVRRAQDACESCGRRHDGRDPAWTSSAAAARWGKVAAYVAALIPVIYAATRIAWVLGIPLGVPPEFIVGLASEDGWLAALGLGAAATVGALLTIGLTRRWGEVFPWWTLWLRGRRVPVKVAVVPASVVACAVLAAGLSLITTGLRTGALALSLDNWGAIGPELLWPLWAAALGAATYAYWLRRRGTCRACGRG